MLDFIKWNTLYLPIIAALICLLIGWIFDQYVTELKRSGNRKRALKSAFISKFFTITGMCWGALFIVFLIVIIYRYATT